MMPFILFKTFYWAVKASINFITCTPSAALQGLGPYLKNSVPLHQSWVAARAAMHQTKRFPVYHLRLKKSVATKNRKLNTAFCSYYFAQIRVVVRQLKNSTNH